MRESEEIPNRPPTRACRSADNSGRRNVADSAVFGIIPPQHLLQIDVGVDIRRSHGESFQLSRYSPPNRSLVAQMSAPTPHPTAVATTIPHRGGNCREMRPVAPVAQMDRVAASEGTD